MNLRRLLPLGGKRRGEETPWDQREEGASLHHGSSLIPSKRFAA
jgi:hypothetical protein